MFQTQKWLCNFVIGSIALGLVGVMSTGQANAAGMQHRYRESEWRHSHPHWNGRYYWHNNGYYYDRAYTYPAIVDNDYSTIGGGVILNNDPYVYFNGNYGQYYPEASLNIDLGSSDRARHARALYFQHPYFWRNGVRYDRTTVTRHGGTYYRFARHRY